MDLIIKIAYSLIVIIALSSCSNINFIKSGIYKVTQNNATKNNSLFPEETVLKVNSKKRQVIIQQKSQRPEKFQARVLPKKKWIEDCQTNLSREVLEVWELSSSTQQAKLYILAACFNNERVFITDSLEILGKNTPFDLNKK